MRDVGPVIVEFRARGVPLKHRTWEVVEDDDARATVRAIIDGGLYERMV